ncbi:uncharacterized protein LTR77_010012 [Saxophila tyrrhenica]|uniref:ubiquitinyl hydrolase 1 n=1 Tax=Saxophila tyrrhenica TaxID=1690608 RepID=A0AAV9P028_9PEZI|nr:hypothetical protein LTR77_010012 [Saxophila tyrrhenica]
MASQHQQAHHFNPQWYFYQPPGQVYHDPVYAPVDYRVQQVAPQQQTPTHQHQAFVTAAGFTALRPQQQRLPVRTRQQTRHARATMASEGQQHAGPSEDEMAEMQKLSNEYEPEVKGPLVGQRQSTNNLTTEYASADPVYQAKTTNLPQKYSHYRTVRGDGSCGWRAIAFGYFETLINLGDGNKFLEEEARLRSLMNTCTAAGYDPSLLEDFAEETYTLLRKVANGMQDGTAENALHETFNDDYVQNFIITHIRTLTAAWMKTHSQDYIPWVVGGSSIDQYCEQSVTPVSSELEHLSLNALKDVLLSPAGITLEVLYLDRSHGKEVNMHRFSPVNHGGYDIGYIRLLYRPLVMNDSFLSRSADISNRGHYDILYMPSDLPPVPVPAAVPTYLQYASQPYHEPVYDLGLPDFMTTIPGMSYANPHQAWVGSSYADSDFFGSSAPVQQCPQPIPAPAVPAPQPQMQAAPVYVPAATAHLVPPPTQMPEELVIRTVPQANVSSHQGFAPQSTGPFRPSTWQLEADMSQHTPLQTAIFRK